MPEIEPIDPMREQGIRLHARVASETGPQAEMGMINDLLLALDRQRIEINGLKTALSVYERRSHLSKMSAFTEAEESMIRFALDTVSQVVLSRPNEFSSEDVAALEELKRWVGE